MFIKHSSAPITALVLLAALSCAFVFSGCGTDAAVRSPASAATEAHRPPPPPPPLPAPSPGGPTPPVNGNVGALTKGLPTQLDIPEGYLPQPGSCRIWFPHRPAGQQPPPGDCEELVYEVPAGAWLLSRPAQEREHIHVIEYHPNQPTVEIAVRVFAAATGQFVRDVKPPPQEQETRPGENRDPNQKPAGEANDPKNPR